VIAQPAPIADRAHEAVVHRVERGLLVARDRLREADEPREAVAVDGFDGGERVVTAHAPTITGTRRRV
jgi:hypothetical protein